MEPESGSLGNQKLCPSCTKYATYLTRNVCKKCLASFEETIEDNHDDGSGSNKTKQLLCLNKTRRKKHLTSSCSSCRNCLINIFIENTGYVYTNPAGSCRKCGDRTIIEVHECSKCLWQSPSSVTAEPQPVTSPIPYERITKKRTRSTLRSSDDSSSQKRVNKESKKKEQEKRSKRKDPVIKKSSSVYKRKKPKSAANKERKESLRSFVPEVPPAKPSVDLPPPLMDIIEKYVIEPLLISEPITVETNPTEFLPTFEQLLENFIATSDSY